MTATDLKTLFDYGYWANRTLFDAVGRLTADEFTQPVAGSYGSVRNTLVHTLSAEAGWLDRCGGPKRGPRLDPSDYPTFDSVQQAWTRVEGQVREFLATLSDADLARRIEYSFNPAHTNSGTIGELMHHAANHAVHHRGQVALLLRMLGHAPGDFDLLFYYARPRQV
ncbi:MAG TPA: DinB family protein [Vicinamibacterales bacterium]|nr:DinB family protein [Vicinamibacterales bacterium]